MAHFVPLAKLPSPSELAELFVHHVFRLHGLPLHIASDRGPQFTAKYWRALCKKFGVQLDLTTAFHPQVISTFPASAPSLWQFFAAQQSAAFSPCPAAVTAPGSLITSCNHLPMTSRIRASCSTPLARDKGPFACEKSLITCNTRMGTESGQIRPWKRRSRGVTGTDSAPTPRTAKRTYKPPSGQNLFMADYNKRPKLKAQKDTNVLTEKQAQQKVTGGRMHRGKAGLNDTHYTHSKCLTRLGLRDKHHTKRHL
ncbi:uncharacterized protein LOC115094706 [Rhinatrema bivittatum]|uniref:uncharacterized protein LOC115094706 n=1 Tax=Rhinatrema bivittatum TaxID=194408 RepID=UPI001125C519|nr:uncharacterized protein LOC115094706 [Rhinatrema bivittatum]